MLRSWIIALLYLSCTVPGSQSDGTVFVHLHTFTAARGCPDYTVSVPGGRHSSSCEVYLRVCLQPNEKSSVALCPMSSYTTQRFTNVGGERSVTLSTAQPAKLSFSGAAQGYSVLVEAWGHEEVDSSKFHILTTFVVPVTQSLGEWSANKVYNDPYPAEIALQWQVTCSGGFLPVGVCSGSCKRTHCVLCLDSGKQECRVGCTREECIVQGMDPALLPDWSEWTIWSSCSCDAGTQTRIRTCQSANQTAIEEAIPDQACGWDSLETRQCSNNSEDCSPVQRECGMGCQNGGLCQLLGVVDVRGREQYRCVCEENYVGRHCQHVIERSSLAEDENLAVTIAVFISVGVAAVMLVAALCLCHRRCRGERVPTPVKHNGAPASATGTMDSRRSNNSLEMTADSSASKSNGSAQSTSGRFKNVRKSLSIVHPHFKPRKSWSRRSSKLAVQDTSGINASSTSLNSDTFVTPPSTMKDISRLNAIVETSENTAPSPTPVSEPTSKLTPAFIARVAPRRGSQKSTQQDEEVYHPPSAAAVPPLETTQYEEISDGGVYEDVHVQSTQSEQAPRKSVNTMAPGSTSTIRSASSGISSLKRGIAARFGGCIGSRMPAENTNRVVPKPVPFSPAAVFGTSDAENGLHKAINAPSNTPEQRNSTLTWWSKRSSGSNQPWGFLRLGGSQDAEPGSMSLNSSNSSGKMANNILYQ